MPGRTERVNQPVVSEKSNEIKNVAKLEVYLVNYADGDARDQTRIVFSDPKMKDATFILRQIVQGNPTIAPASGWFERSFRAAIEQAESGDAGVESI